MSDKPLLCRLFGHHWQHQTHRGYEDGQYARPVTVTVRRSCTRCMATQTFINGRREEGLGYGIGPS